MDLCFDSCLSITQRLVTSQSVALVNDRLRGIAGLREIELADSAHAELRYRFDLKTG
jgi:hypothetical protein